MAEEWTLVLVKPDGVKNRHVGEVITRIERKGYQIIDLKMIEPTENKLRQHYADKVNEPYFAGLMSYMTCLLYTSPSPRDRSVSRMPSSA